MRPNASKFPAPQIHRRLISPVGFQLHPDVPMHPFVAAICPADGPAGRAPNQCPRQPTTPIIGSTHTDMGKGSAVVTANGSGQPMQLK